MPVSGSFASRAKHYSIFGAIPIDLHHNALTEMAPVLSDEIVRPILDFYQAQVGQ